MASGHLDSNGVWIFGEDDKASLFSDLLNLGQNNTSLALTADRARLSNLEARATSLEQLPNDSGWINVGASGAPAFATGISNSGGSSPNNYQVARFRRAWGFEDVEGVINGTTGSAFLLFTLPPGHRPPGVVRGFASSGTYIEIKPTGEVSSTITGTKTQLAFHARFGL